MRKQDVLAFCYAGILGFAKVAQAQSDQGSNFGVWDEPSHFFPGAYFEKKAQFYIKKKQYPAALEMFKLSGYWADKRAQYNAGVMLFNGIGVPVDRVAGVAWLRIAAESKGDLAERTLTLAEAKLTDAQRAESEAIWRELDAKYGNKVALARAIQRYQLDRAAVVNHGWGHTEVAEYTGKLNPHGGDVSLFLKKKDAELARLVEEVSGSVTIGAVQTLPVSDDAKKNASKTPVFPDAKAESAQAHD